MHCLVILCSRTCSLQQNSQMQSFTLGKTLGKAGAKIMCEFNGICRTLTVHLPLLMLRVQICVPNSPDKILFLINVKLTVPNQDFITVFKM